MSWIKVTLETSAETVEQVSDLLTDLGAVSVSWQDAIGQPLYEPELNTTPLWQYTRITGLFSQETNLSGLPEQLQSLNIPVSIYHTETVADIDWQHAWMSDFHPMRFGKRLWICPSWEEPIEPEAVNVFLDPGLAFGTGTHPTTALCLEWLDAQDSLGSKQIIDYGCGSGILAIAAIKLGAAHVWAIDYDPQALQATYDNAKKNQVDAFLSIGLPEELPKQYQPDVLMANILANPLIKLAPSFAEQLTPGAQLVLSGILEEQTHSVVAAYHEQFQFIAQVERDNWMRLVATRR